MAINLEVDKTYLTRSGLNAVITETFIVDGSPMHRGVVHTEPPQTTIWNCDGSHFINSARDIVDIVTE